MFLLLLFISIVHAVNLQSISVYKWTDHYLQVQNVHNKFAVDIVKIDPQDQSTILAFAMMSSYAYDEPDPINWDPVPGYYLNSSIGWDMSQLRGHIFGSITDQVFVIVIKGTSLTGDTRYYDKVMDNLMFSCCYDDCQLLAQKAAVCDNTCIRKILLDPNTLSYPNLAYAFYQNIHTKYPNAEIWLSGHSLGGATSNILGLREHIPALTFNAPGDQLYAHRLGLHDEGSRIYQYGNTGDPLFNGDCGTLCWIGGYDIDTKCHIGYSCVYKVNGTSINYHRIDYVIDLIVNNAVPECYIEKCQDCIDWTFVGDI
jgi:lipase ATG15